VHTARKERRWTAAPNAFRILSEVIRCGPAGWVCCWWNVSAAWGVGRMQSGVTRVWCELVVGVS
jgi:hypothetical protein